MKMLPEFPEIVERVEQVRGELGMSKTAFCKFLGFTHQSYQRMTESGDVRPNLHLVILLCRQFNLSAEWVVFGHGPQYVEKK